MHLGRSQLSTELSLSADEFDTYDVYSCPTTIAFHLREFIVSVLASPLPSADVFVAGYDSIC